MQKIKGNFFLKALSKISLVLFVLLPFSVLAMDSSNYSIDSDIINYYTGESDSSSYNLNAVGGETGSGESSSSSYEMGSGYEYADSDYIISLSCSSSVNMGNIAGVGRSDLSTNDATCSIETDNPIGYKLYWQASSANMISGAESIGAYTPAVSETPEAWSVNSTDSEWGARLKKSGTTSYDSIKWGDANSGDGYASSDVKWLNVSNIAGYEIIERTSATGAGGDTEVLQFGAEVGLNKLQPSGSYSVNLTITAVAL